VALNPPPKPRATTPLGASGRRPPITGLLLCGGAGRRMGGADKPLVGYHQRPLVEWVLARIRPQVDSILISANRHLAVYQNYGAVITDDRPDYRGPLAGILAGLRAATTEWVLACPGDTPHLPANLVAVLWAALQNGGVGKKASHIALPHDGERAQPLPMLVHRASAADLTAYLDAGGRSVYGWLDDRRTVIAPFDCAADAFRSLNQPADFELPAS
jgi:molybdopterin-guanine dinucleotide biosynthesis protein A